MTRATTEVTEKKVSRYITPRCTAARAKAVVAATAHATKSRNIQDAVAFATVTGVLTSATYTKTFVARHCAKR